MKITNRDPDHADDATRGRRSTNLAGSKGMIWRDASTESVGQIRDMTVIGGDFHDNEDGTGILTVGSGDGSVVPNVNAPIITADLSNPPTQAELETAIGFPPGEVPGQAYVVTDSDTGLGYVVWSNGEAFEFLPTVQTASDAATVAAGAGVFSDFTAQVGAAAYDAVSDKTFWVYLNGAGDACIRSYDHATQIASSATVMRAALDPGDSHGQPCVGIRSSDRRVEALYSKHVGTALYRWLSTSVADISAGTETNIAASVGGTDYTYSVRIELSDATYNFLRTYTGTTPGGAFNHAGAIWSYTKSLDGGATWSAKVEVMSDATYGMYWMPTKTADDRVDFLATDRSPFDATGGSLFHMYMIAGTFYETDGTAITATKPFNSTVMTEVWASDGTQRADPGMVVLDPDTEDPRMVFRVFETISPEDCRYWWGRYAAGFWANQEIASAGSGSLTATTVLEPDNPAAVWYSKDTGGVAQIHRITTPDNGTTWVDRQMTDSASEQALLAAVGAPGMTVMWNSKSGGWTRNDTVAADFMGASFVPTTGADAQRLVIIDGTGRAEAIWQRTSGGTWQVSRDLGTTWEDFGGAEIAASASLLTVDPGTPTYDDSGDDVVVTLASVWGVGGDGPYYNSAGVTSGEEAILAMDSTDGQFVVVPYYP